MCRSFFVLIFLLLVFPTKGFSLCVNASMANLRSGPGSQHAVSWVVGRYTPLVYEAAQGPWYKVKDQDGKRHWVHRRLVTNRFKCLSIKTRTANLRKGAGSQFPTIKYRAAEKYETFLRLEKEGKWYSVKNNYGKKAWVHKSNVWIPRRNISVNF